MEEARALLARLELIERLELEGECPRKLLGQLSTLLAEGERWLAAERGGDGRAVAALERCRRALAEGRLSAVR